MLKRSHPLSLTQCDTGKGALRHLESFSVGITRINDSVSQKEQTMRQRCSQLLACVLSNQTEQESASASLNVWKKDWSDKYKRWYW